MLSDSLQEVLKRAFAEEAKRLLENFEEDLAALTTADSGSKRREHFGNLRRTAHTLKGASRSVEFAEVESLSLVLEKKFKSLATESDEPFLNEDSLGILHKAVEFLDRTVNSLLEDSNSVVASTELMELMTAVEDLALDSAPNTNAFQLPDSERDRVRFLVKMLRKTTGGDASGTAIKKAFQILLSLNKIAKDNKLTNISPLTEALETSFRTLTSDKSAKDWPNFALSLELLQKFGKNPGNFQSDLLPEAMAELAESSEETDNKEQLSDAFLEETNGSLDELRAILNEASIDGKLPKKRLRVCLMSLTGATRVVDLPTAETICRSLEYALTKFAAAGRAPAVLLARAAEAVELLAQEVQAFAEGKAGLPSWKAMHVVERLESAVDEIDTLGLEEAPAVEAPVPTAEPVSAEAEPPKKSKTKTKAKTKSKKTKSAPQKTESSEPKDRGVTQSQQDWARRTLRSQAPLQGLVETLLEQTNLAAKLAPLLPEWSTQTEELASLIEESTDDEFKSKASHFLQAQRHNLDLVASLSKITASDSERHRSLLEDCRRARQELSSHFQASEQTLKSRLENEITLQNKGASLAVDCDTLQWDERYWDDGELGGVSQSILDWLQSHCSANKPAVEIKATPADGLTLTYSIPNETMSRSPSEAPQKLLAKARELYGNLELPKQAGSELQATLKLRQVMAETRAVFFRSGGQNWAIPTHCVWGVQRIASDQELGETLTLSDKTFEVHHLCPDSKASVALCAEHPDGRSTAFLVDEVLGEELMVQSDQEDAETSWLFRGGQTAQTLSLVGERPSLESQAEPAEPEAKPGLVLAQTYLPAAKVLSKSLTRAGYEVKLAAEGQEALDLLEEMTNEVKFLIADFHLPDMHGETLCETIASHPDAPDVSCLVLKSGEDAHSRSASVKAYLDKSEFDLSQLLEHLKV